MSGRGYWGLGCLLGMAIFLVAFVAPVFWRAHGKAAQTACKSNCEALTLSLLIYASDHDGRLPNMLVWAPELKPYYRNDYILICQGDERLPLSQRPMVDVKWAEQANFISYGMLQRWSHQKLPPAAQAARGVVLYEAGESGLSYRHSGGMWLGFLDGHQKYYLADEMTPTMILSGVSHETPGAQRQPQP